MICSECPYRRDADRQPELIQHFFEMTIAIWDDRSPFHPRRCGDSPCLGLAIMLNNFRVGSLVKNLDKELFELMEEYDLDEDLCFAGTSEFVRYHRGEHFGSAEWRQEWKIHFGYVQDELPLEPAQDEQPLGPAQGELF